VHPLTTRRHHVDAWVPTWHAARNRRLSIRGAGDRGPPDPWSAGCSACPGFTTTDYGK